MTLVRLPLEGQLSPARELNRLARAHPDAWIAWYDRRLEPWLSDPASWPGLARHDLEVLHLGCFQRTDLVAGSLGLVDFDSPWLLPGPRDRRFATWLISPAAGIARAAAIRAVAPDRTGSLAGFLFELGLRGIRHGLSPVSEPALLAGSVPEEVWDRMPLSDDDLARLIRRGYGRKWLGFWLLARRLSEGKLSPATVGAALRAWMAKEPGREAVLAALHPALPDENPDENVDALIPTLGRPEALQDVLRDLAAQTVPPRRVIVVGQAGSPPPAGEWPFELLFLSRSAPGACTARNAGLREARSEWVLLLDDDVRLQPGLVSYLLRIARAWGAEAVNAAVHLPGERVGSQGPRPWPVFASGASLVSTRILEEAGGFDERLDGGYGEDYEIGIRLRLAGAGVLYAPGEPVLHLKLPAGGLREGTPLPWSNDLIPPRPSPPVLYSRRKHHPQAMQDGYRLYYSLKRLGGKPLHAWPREVRTMGREWERAAWWAGRMLEGDV
ncbi:MAG TPA: glycosyltransferase [Thermoanaerobaculia bacterium]|nr:glycosyltransferase [Thermoanaerobaculia bacterium]